MAGLNAAKGKYIALCEGDDYWTDPLKLQQQIDFLERHSDYSACFHPVQIWQEDRQELVEDSITRKVPATTSLDDLIVGNYIHTPSIVYRNRTYPEWFQRVPLGDYAIHCLNALDGKIFKLEQPMAVYRVHTAGMMQVYTENNKDKYSQKALSFAQGMYELYAYLYEQTKNPSLENYLYQHLVFLKECALNQGAIPQAKHYAKQLLKNYPHKLSPKAKLSLWATTLFPSIIKKIKK